MAKEYRSPGWRPLISALSGKEAQQVMDEHRERLIFRLKMVRRDDMTPIFDQLNHEMGVFRA